MALVDTGAEMSIVHCDLSKFPSTQAIIGGYGGKMIPVMQTWLKLGVGCLPPQEYRVSILPIQEYILDIDTLRGLTL